MPDISFDETELIRRLIARDQAALSELYAQFGGLVYSVALRVVQNNTLAEEITQDTFLKVWNQPTLWDSSRGRFVSWLLTITRYTAIDRLRMERRRPMRDSLELDDLRLGQRGLMDDPVWQDGKLLRSLLEHLPPDQIQVIEMAFFEGMSHSEMAEQLQIPLGTIKTRVRLGLQKLRSLWQEAADA
jgi:RNA polymerase sigma-70 factor (ECF subfamily)